MQKTKSLPQKSGIYKITSPSGRIYIGQAVDINKRWKEYNRPSGAMTQCKLYNSFKKYGSKIHTFEIIEECEINDLNCRERFWQDEYDVLGKNGLNCILTECGEKRKVYSEESKKRTRETKLKNKGNYRGRSKIVLCTQTGIFYDSLKKACEALGLKYVNVKDKLNPKSRRNNDTSLVYIEDYKGGEIINEELLSENWKKVLDTVTGIVYNSVAQAARALDINYEYLKSKLNGSSKNDTTLIHLEKYELQ